MRRRGVLEPIWEALTLIRRGLDDGQPELLFWKYVYTDVKADPSDVWYSISPFLNSWPNLSSVY